MHILIFLSKMWAKICALYTAKYGKLGALCFPLGPCIKSEYSQRQCQAQVQQRCLVGAGAQVNHLVWVAGVSPQGSGLAGEARVGVLGEQKQRVVPSMRETEWWPVWQASHMSCG